MHITDLILPKVLDDGNHGDYEGDNPQDEILLDLRNWIDKLLSSEVVGNISVMFYDHRSNSYGEEMTALTADEFMAIIDKGTEHVTPVPMIRDKNGLLIAAHVKDAYSLVVDRGVTEFFRANKGDSVATVGKIDDSRWIGWSHRAVGEFNLSYEVKDGDVVADDGGYAIGYKPKTSEDLKNLATTFAEQVG